MFFSQFTFAKEIHFFFSFFVGFHGSLKPICFHGDERQRSKRAVSIAAANFSVCQILRSLWPFFGDYILHLNKASVSFNIHLLNNTFSFQWIMWVYHPRRPSGLCLPCYPPSKKTKRRRKRIKWDLKTLKQKERIRKYVNTFFNLTREWLHLHSWALDKLVSLHRILKKVKGQHSSSGSHSCFKNIHICALQNNDKKHKKLGKSLFLNLQIMQRNPLCGLYWT